MFVWLVSEFDTHYQYLHELFLHDKLLKTNFDRSANLVHVWFIEINGITL